MYPRAWLLLFTGLCLATLARQPVPAAPPQAEVKPMLRIRWERGPDLPQGFQDSDGGFIGTRLITVGGFCGGGDDARKPGHYPRGFPKKAWALDLADAKPGWASLPAFPGGARQEV